MLDAAKNLEFEKAAGHRDEIKKLRSQLFVGFVEPEDDDGQKLASRGRIGKKSQKTVS